jgi:hypothetical protein
MKSFQIFFVCILFPLFLQCTSKKKPLKGLSFELIEAARGNDSVFIWTQARAVMYPDQNRPIALMTLSKKLRKGEDVYYDLYQMQSEDSGKTWSDPDIIPSLKIHDIGSGYWRSMSDMTPQWHEKSGTILNIGKSFFYTDLKDLDRSKREVAYACYHPKNKNWGAFRVLELPQMDKDSNLIIAPGSGCVQFVIEDNGDVILPFTYYALTKQQFQSVTRETFAVRNFMKSDDLGASVSVVRCSYDGNNLSFVALGNALIVKQGRGLGEPSLVKFKEKWYLTMRSDKTAFLSTSKDGLLFSQPKAWTFDNDSVLGSYNTQQHWAVLNNNLYLIYTRPAGNNDHVFRHRAPLFIAKVDTDREVVLKHTEQICIPEDGVALGNFGVTHINQQEVWVVSSEYLRNEPPDKKNRVWVAKVKPDQQ